MAGVLLPSTEPFFFPGDDVGCLLIHGFTGAPKEMRWMGEHLAEKGHTVLAVRLSGHATRPEDMIRTRWPDWLACAEDGYHLLSGVVNQIFVLGLSMGGVLSLMLASHYPVQGVVAMSTPYELPADPRLRWMKWLHWLVPFVPKGESDWLDQQALEEHFSYDAYPTRSLIELQSLLPEMRASLPQISAPTLLMHSKNDAGVDPGSMPKLYQDIGSADKQMLWFEKSGHVLTRDASREDVFQAASNFIEQKLSR
jgi:carboxylesterase